MSEREPDQYDKQATVLLPCDCNNRDGKGGHFTSCAGYWREDVADTLRAQGIEIERLNIELAEWKARFDALLKREGK